MTQPHAPSGPGLDSAYLANRVALVTGSSRGIGAAIATLFARHGAHVAVHGRDARAALAVSAGIQKEGGRAIHVTGDVTSFADIEAIRRRIESELGPVDILVANAGGSPVRPCPMEDITEEEWHTSINGNLTATFLTLKSFIPGMKARKSGCIITMSSAAARTPHPNAPLAYGTAKAAIAKLTQDLAAQIGIFGVRVNSIAPDSIMTERNAERIPAAQIQPLIDMHPIRRLGTPSDVAQAALYLASDSASWITGIIIDVAGGAVMT